MWKKKKPESAAKKLHWKAVQALVKAERLIDDLLVDEKDACAEVAEEMAEIRNQLESLEMELFQLRDRLREEIPTEEEEEDTDEWLPDGEMK